MRYHQFFEWHDQKAETNKRKHRVTFEDAAAVLADDHADRYHLERYDDMHSMGENRYVTIASHPAKRSIVLFICWTQRRKKGGRVVTRIISLPPATPRKGRSMPKRSGTSKLVQISADAIPKPTRQDLDRLARHAIPVRPSEAEESKDIGPIVRRKASGELPERPLGPVRRAILASLDHHGMTRYQLWKKAHARCETLSASAVYDYLRGVRDIGIEYAETPMEAANLKVVGRGRPGPKRLTIGNSKRLSTS